MEPTHQNTNKASTVIVKCALVVLFLSGLINQCSSTTCRRHPVGHIIRYEGCAPKRVPTFGCRGTCTSYSRVSPTDYTRMERSCQCCQESDHTTREVTLLCPSLLAIRKVNLRVATSCTCRPCHEASGVASETRLEDLLQ